MLLRVLREPPFRLMGKLASRYFPCSIETKALWDALPRPQYLNGVLAAARQAKREGVREITVVEFGVAGGAGLLLLEKYARLVSMETRIGINVVGFDAGTGMPESTGDYRDHPDLWKPGDFRMDFEALQNRLSPSTQLVLGPIARTVDAFVFTAPLGFVSIDVDFYSSTKDALKVFDKLSGKGLARVAVYFDDVRLAACHRFAGELLAIDEFNQEHTDIKIDRWYSLADERPFPEASWIQQMYFAHDLARISDTVLQRKNVHLTLKID